MTAEPMDPDTNGRPSKGFGDEMLSLQEACAFLRVPEGTLRYWRADLILWLTEQTNRPQGRD